MVADVNLGYQIYFIQFSPISRGRDKTCTPFWTQKKILYMLKKYLTVKPCRKSTPFSLKFTFNFLSSVQYFTEFLLTIVKIAYYPNISTNCSKKSQYPTTYYIMLAILISESNWTIMTIWRVESNNSHRDRSKLLQLNSFITSSKFSAK